MEKTVLSGPARRQAPSQLALALYDLVAGARATDLWAHFAWQDIRRNYRGSMLGPFWGAFNLGLLVLMLGGLFGGFFDIEANRYIPHLALGLAVWTLVNSLIVSGCQTFKGASRFIQQTQLPLSVHVYRCIFLNLLHFVHNCAVFVVAAVVFAIWPGWTGLLVIPGIVLLCLNGVWVGVLLGLLTARFNDVPPTIQSLIRLLFYATPIIWMPEMQPHRNDFAHLTNLNPFFHAIEIVRAPLLGQAPSAASWLVMLGFLVVGGGSTFAIFVRYRWRIGYWV